MKYPHWVCYDCGIEAYKETSKYRELGEPILISTYHVGRCHVCGKEKPVTEPRDFRYPNFVGYEFMYDEKKLFDGTM